MKNLRKTFFGSVVSLLICFTMLLGTTFAWFTDSVTSSNNKIIAGTLDIELWQYVYDDTTDAWKWEDISASTDALFDYENWEPGYTEYVVLKVVNAGNLALKWKATFNSATALSKLADVINVYVNPTAPAAEGTYDTLNVPANREAALAYSPAGTLREFISNLESVTKGELKANEEACLTLVLQMDPLAGNDYMDLDLGGAFDISIVATQNTVEEDSFDDQYDANAEYPVLNCDHSAGTTDTVTYTKTATGHTATTITTCNACHATTNTVVGTEEAHVDTNPADYACDTCGYDMTPAHTHVYTADINSDATHHWGVCSCGDEDTANKVAHTDADNDGNHNCDTCNAPNVTTCADSPVVDGKCDECGADVDHTCEDNDSNHLCDVCGEETSTCTYAVTPNNDGATHTVTVCSVCNKGNNVGTDCEDTDSDNKCDVCDGDVTSAPATPSTTTKSVTATFSATFSDEETWGTSPSVDMSTASAGIASSGNNAVNIIDIIKAFTAVEDIEELTITTTTDSYETWTRETEGISNGNVVEAIGQEKTLGLSYGLNSDYSPQFTSWSMSNNNSKTFTKADIEALGADLTKVSVRVFNGKPNSTIDFTVTIDIKYASTGTEENKLSTDITLDPAVSASLTDDASFFPYAETYQTGTVVSIIVNGTATLSDENTSGSMKVMTSATSNKNNGASVEYSSTFTISENGDFTVIATYTLNKESNGFILKEIKNFSDVTITSYQVYEGTKAEYEVYKEYNN